MDKGWKRFYRESYVRILVTLVIACSGLIGTAIAMSAVGLGMITIPVNFTITIPVTLILVELSLLLIAFFLGIMMFKNGLWAWHIRNMINDNEE